MKPTIFLSLFIALWQTAPVQAGDLTSKSDLEACKHWPAWSRHACKRLHETWTEGKTEVYFTGYAWHNRYIYEKFRTDTYNELAWGGGLGKGFVDEDGDWHGLYAIAFLDSHKNVEPTAGYAFLKTLNFTNGSRVGLGYTVLVTSRPDISHNIPFAGALPWVSVGYRKLAILASYIPGSRKSGNVLFVLAKWTI